MNGLALARLRPAAAAFTVAGLALCLAGLFVEPRQVLAAWWTAALFLLGLPLGAMTVLMIHMLTGGRWGDGVRAPLRAVTALTPVALVLILPLLLGLETALPWAQTAGAALPETVRQKLAYLNLPFFVVRFALCGLIWLGLWRLVLALTGPAARDDPRALSRRAKWCAAGLVLNGLAVTVFSTDWMLSLEPQFYSTIYAFLEASAEVCGAFALALILYVASLGPTVPEGGEADVLVTEDMANMLFGFVMMWTYLAFMQYLIIWAADLPDEIGWYIARGRHGWQVVLWALVLFHAVLPMAGFLSRRLKRSRKGVIALAAMVLFGHFLDRLWRVRPAFPGTTLAAAWIDVGAFLAVLGLAAAALAFPLRHALIPERPAHG